MIMFEIRQKIPDGMIGDEYPDMDEIHIGFVSDEFFAQEFCEAHPDCSYGPVLETKYSNHLEGNLIDSLDDLTIIRIPVKKWEED